MILGIYYTLTSLPHILAVTFFRHFWTESSVSALRIRKKYSCNYVFRTGSCVSGLLVTRKAAPFFKLASREIKREAGDEATVYSCDKRNQIVLVDMPQH